MTPTIQPAPVRRSVTVKAPPERAFQVFTAGIDRWWPATHHIGASPLKQPVLEPGVGGRWYAICQDDSECEIGKVLVWDPPGRLVLAWQIRQWAYDPSVQTEIEVLFTALDDGTTRVDLEHRHLERLGDTAEASRAQFEAPNGWGLILTLFADTASQGASS
jgi:uncharacterized protein YndB with AHSA1/START domain